MEKYTSDCKYNVSELKKRIDLIMNLKNQLIDYKGFNNDTKINEMIKILDADLQVCKEYYNDCYPDGVYVLYKDFLKYPKGTLIQRVEDEDSCEKCIFNSIPCLSINSYYGCHRKKNSKYYKQNEKNGLELVNTGYFIEIEKINK